MVYAASDYMESMLADDSASLNETRKTTKTMIGLVFLMLLEAFKEYLSKTSNFVASVFFYSFVVARIVSIIIDGNLGASLIEGVVY